ncbi:sulfhydryl oxidase 1 [Erpetoichthys calabaricus]|uniref:Sulfhydryl oxidase n=1 Tax=Erpetoichthys calabaricus TaxID=27687 RepID=A0A8C4S626_ERPCA|nr:sulfhydryl oxidase 1 [Erpetoichthys calabaricus]
MARRVGGCATSLCRGATSLLVPPLLLLLLAYAGPSAAGLYGPTDQIVILQADNVRALILNASSAWLVEFYASWCGHCQRFAPLWKELAMDIREWKPAINLAAINCADITNRFTCANFEVDGYPTLKFFPAYSPPDSVGEPVKAAKRVQSLRQTIITLLEKHGESWPPACPPLEPISQAELGSFFETNSVEYLALVFEKNSSFIGREVTLDLLQFENIAVRRVQDTEEALVSQLAVTDFPSCYLYYPNGTHTRLSVQIENRWFYTYALQNLPGVVRGGYKNVGISGVDNATISEAWQEFDRSRIYMADLESSVSYALRVEVGTHRVLTRKQLSALKSYVSVLVKYFPGRPIMMNFLQVLNSWLKSYTESELPYSTLEKEMENGFNVPNLALPPTIKWVACQGSRTHFRGYPCSVWTLFHLLTVQALQNEKASSRDADPQEVLKAMLGYIKNFFGCRECASHFESMATESMSSVRSLEQSVLWLWQRHNHVNSRLAGAPSEDPKFPKIQFPPPDVCLACHSELNGEHTWKTDKVLQFLKERFSADRILNDYLEEESQILAKQKEKLAAQRQAESDRLAQENQKWTQEPVVGLAVEGGKDEPEEEDPGIPQEQRDEAPMEEVDLGRNHKPSIVKGSLRHRETEDDIVDLDTFVDQHYKSKALQAAARKRSLSKREERHKPLQFQTEDLDLKDDMALHSRLKKRGLSSKRVMVNEELLINEHWLSVFSVGFSRLDVSLCVLLYLLSTMCLLGMYMFFKLRLRMRKQKQALA